MIEPHDFMDEYGYYARAFLDEDSLSWRRVDVGKWHAMDVSDKPHLVSREMAGECISYHMPATKLAAQANIIPNLPWAEDQFQERVSGEPLNPGETYKSWPWQSNMGQHVQDVFSHTYMERYWPKNANAMTDAGAANPGPGDYHTNWGIRYRYGDLNDLVSLLAREPYTRQAVLPVWFPEDTGAVDGQRVPCSLSYQFLLRDNKLHCFYSIRSCDFVRHFRDDVYHTTRLVQWVIEEVRRKALERVQLIQGMVEDDPWYDVTPGVLQMNIGSFHIFEGDVPKLKREYAQ